VTGGRVGQNLKKQRQDTARHWDVTVKKTTNHKRGQRMGKRKGESRKKRGGKSWKGGKSTKVEGGGRVAFKEGPSRAKPGHPPRYEGGGEKQTNASKDGGGDF